MYVFGFMSIESTPSSIHFRKVGWQTHTQDDYSKISKQKPGKTGATILNSPCRLLQVPCRRKVTQHCQIHSVLLEYVIKDTSDKMAGMITVRVILTSTLSPAQQALIHLFSQQGLLLYQGTKMFYKNRVK